MKYGILCGGFSHEREISLKSAESILSCLRENACAVTCADPLLIADQVFDEKIFTARQRPLPRFPQQRHHYWQALLYFRQQEVDVVILALHGGEGEDGRVQALLEMAGLPYTGSGPLASGLAMNKHLSKQLVAFEGIKTAPWHLVDNTDNLPALTTAEQWVVKGNNQGSSVGLSIIDDPSELAAACAHALQSDHQVLIETYIAGRELTVGVLDGKALPVLEIVPQSGLYDFHHKYTKGASEYLVPAPIDSETARQLQKSSEQIWQILQLSGYARIDFRLTTDNQFYFLEANTLPGMTDLSLFPMAAKAVDIDFFKLLTMLTELASQRFQGLKNG
jgi:D-alanine-D-alanine ligase